MEKYNGWTNRSTWLVNVHLNNTSKEISDQIVPIAVKANTLKQFENPIKILLLDTQIEKESDYDINTVNWDEIWDAHRTP